MSNWSWWSLWRKPKPEPRNELLVALHAMPFDIALRVVQDLVRANHCMIADPAVRSWINKNCGRVSAMWHMGVLPYPIWEKAQ